MSSLKIVVTSNISVQKQIKSKNIPVSLENDKITIFQIHWYVIQTVII